MDENMNLAKQVSDQYLQLRSQVLNYSNVDMGLTLENDEQVYIALFDIPLESGVVGFNTQSLALIFGLNTHLYNGSGTYLVGLEKYSKVMVAMQSLLISSHQALSEMELVEKFDFYNSENIRVYLKTRRGVHFRELKNQDKIDKFLTALMNSVMNEISKVV